MANDNAEWITPNLKVAFESTFMLSVMCFGNAPKQQVMLQVIPTQQYLDELKALNLDVRVYSRFDGPSSEIMVRRDQVSSTIGRAVPLEGVRSVSWTPFAVNAEYPFKDGENKNTVSPELTLTLEYVVADIAKRSSGKLPSGRNLLIKVMAAGHESTGLEIRPIESDAHFNVGTCPAPALRVNRAGDAAVAVVDFGNVPLDDLKTYGEAFRAESFTVEFVHPSNMTYNCDMTRNWPHMRFSSAGFYRNGMFEGDPNDPAYPGNSTVAVKLTDGMRAVPGANFGEHDANAYLRFERSDRRSFTATLKRKTNATDQAGRFLIPVTLEAFYY